MRAAINHEPCACGLRVSAAVCNQGRCCPLREPADDAAAVFAGIRNTVLLMLVGVAIGCVFALVL